MKRVMLWLCLFPAVASAQGAQKQQEHPVQRDLRDIGKRLEREMKMLEKLRQRSTQILGSLGELDREIDGLERSTRKASDNLSRHRKELEATRTRRAGLETELERAQHALGRRLRELYKRSGGWMEVIFGAQNTAEVLQDIRWTQRRTRQDAELVGHIQGLRLELAHDQQQLEQLAAAEKQLLVEIKHRQEQLETARRSRMAILQTVRKESSLHRRTVAEMQHARESLSRVLAEMEGRATGGKGFASWQGRLPAPVDGARVEVPFGLIKDEDFGTRTRHPGIDLRAPASSPVKAVYPATVAWADWFDGYGLLVILDHGGGFYTLYAHLEEMKVAKGAKVAAGEVLGKLGDTGSIKGPYLYFEVRRGGQAEDPLKWIRLH